MSNTQAATAKIRAMRRSLEGWLKYRRIMDGVAAGNPAKPLLPAPGVKVVPQNLQAERYHDEQRLADKLYELLSELFPSSQLPSPNVKADPDAAVRLAEIAISGQLPGELNAPAPQGFIWLWPVLIVGGVVLVLSSIVKNFADVAKERERTRCIQSGACTDSGFWLKVGSIAVVGWLAWDKFGLRERFGARGGRRR